MFIANIFGPCPPIIGKSHYHTAPLNMYLDITPKGRNENTIMDWTNRHDVRVPKSEQRRGRRGRHDAPADPHARKYPLHAEGTINQGQHQASKDDFSDQIGIARIE